MQEKEAPRNPLARVDVFLASHERTRAWLARKLALHPSRLTRIANGTRPLTRPVAEGCARVLNVPLELLFDARDLPDGNGDGPEGKLEEVA